MIHIKRKASNRGAEINLTPLIDIVFLLLIFFMLTANFVVNEGVKIKLPETKAHRELAKRPIVVYLTKDNRIFFKGRYVTLDQLRHLLPPEVESNLTKTVVLRSDKNAKVNFAVKVLDIAKLSGAKKFIIATRKEE